VIVCVKFSSVGAGTVLLFILGLNLGGVGPVRDFREGGRRGGVRSRSGAARTILLFHIISARPSKQPRMIESTLGVYSFGLIFVSAGTNKRHHHLVRLIMGNDYPPYITQARHVINGRLPGGSTPFCNASQVYIRCRLCFCAAS